jgi:DNA processing protein
MNNIVSRNTQTILLLTAPLITSQREQSSELLSTGEFNRLMKVLYENNREPSDLLGPEASKVISEIGTSFDIKRLNQLLQRGFLLTQALDKWQTRSIFVVSREDSEYPQRLKSRLQEYSPPVLYGCGDSTILNTGGLAIVGSRNIDEILAEYTENVGCLAARSGYTVISGGARGIDQIAMGGALQAGGKVIGILADSLNRHVLSRELREYIMSDQLVLISPYDPSAGFNVGNAMQRNKSIYALADAALVVSSDYKKGGTWSGAIEQLEKHRFIPVYVRSYGEPEKSLKALMEKGAFSWPEPTDENSFIDIMNNSPLKSVSSIEQGKLDL